MLDMLHEWLVGWADSPVGPAMLGVLSAAEAVFFPLPPDPLLIALALAHPERALVYGALTTATSVAGGLVGHWAGMRFGRPLLRHFPDRRIERVERLFQKHGFWAIAIAGFTPLPFKLFTISAGVFGVPRTPFVIASIVGRAGRFMLIGALIFVWGDRFQRFLDERFDLVLVVMGALLVAAVGVWALWARRNGAAQRRAVAAASTSGTPEASGGPDA